MQFPGGVEKRSQGGCKKVVKGMSLIKSGAKRFPIKSGAAWERHCCIGG